MSYKNTIEIVENDSSSDLILEISDFGNNKYFGNYTFYTNGSLRSYKFFGNKYAYTYNEEYDIDGTLKKAEGTPLVLKNIKDISSDSIFIEFYFFSLNKRYSDLNLKMNNRKLLKLEIKPDSIFSNTESVGYGFNVENIDTVKFGLDINYIDLCNNESRTIVDTIFLVKSNNAHEVLSKKEMRGLYFPDTSASVPLVP